jgi:hypothetical protein
MSINQIHQFLSKENIQVLWDVLIEDQVIKNFCSSHDKIIELTKIFESNLKGFYDIERRNCNTLIELNKKYMVLIINYLSSQIITPITKPITNTQPQQLSQFKKITIHDEQIKQPITYEEIQNERKSQFEKDLYNRQQEFTNAMSNPVPPLPKFSDKLDEPINEIELEIKRIQEQRNYDMEIINKTYQQNVTNQNGINNINSLNDTKNWLQSENTNIKNEKHISWADNHKEPISTLDDTGLFAKLKKKYTPDNNIIINDTLNDILNDNTNFNPLNSFDISEEINFLKNEMNNLNNKLNMLINKIDKIK